MHAVSDLRRPLGGAEARAVAALARAAKRPGGYEGDVPADSCARIGRIHHTLPHATSAGDLSLHLTLSWDGRPGAPAGSAENSYTSRVS